MKNETIERVLESWFEVEVIKNKNNVYEVKNDAIERITETNRKHFSIKLTRIAERTLKAEITTDKWNSKYLRQA
ncbi:hypothetical protein ACTQ5R_09815 [Ruoffia tabacinasalis]|uniref:hypothetical protein n=1 Tax=Ruoffia tabacinasalis TaxID=87458 RepID=UPI003F9EA140